MQRPLRPPGARGEAEFAALCVRCNRCIEICPYGTLRAAGLTPWSEAGTPVVAARAVPCWLCMLCPPACPTGALEPITDRHAVRMGRARVDPETCYAWKGILCRTCIDECPLGAAAIEQDGLLQPRVADGCVGCGVCEHVCPAPEVAIRVEPPRA